GLLFTVRVYTSSQALILRTADPALLVVNACALLAACLVISRTLVRTGHFEMDVYPSPAVLRNSVTLVLVGIYLVLVGLVSKLAAALGTENSLGINAFLILLSIVGLAVALQSDRVQLHLRRFVSRNFQRPFYDYRATWRSFTESTAQQLDQRSLCQAVIRQTADLFQAKSVSVWVTGESGDSLRCVASSALPESEWVEATPDREGTQEILARFRTQPDPVEFDDATERWAETLKRCHPRLFELGGQRVAVPLVSRGTCLGVLILGDRVSGGGFGVQDIDMLRCVADHVAGNLLTLRLSAKLLQSKELEAFQTMAAFFVHDLKNAASTLNLMLPNLPVHWDNPEFREDTLRGITKTVGHINALIRRLGELRHELKLQPRPTSLLELMERAVEGWKVVPDVQLIKEWRPVPKVQADPDQLLTVVTNLILNARDATLEGTSRPGKVVVGLVERDGGVVISVKDNGCGMSPAFLSHSLFRPFQTTKKNGLGIGMFQSKMIVEAHGGRMVVDSIQGKGTTFEVHLPVGTERSEIRGQ
ncbi:MAG: PEP-CTERM system histidine kinase PrsK, partial [Opitutaceae bacterium]|nr:PEP-CTERM system histidine kinase PrsK [Opitutaceae bacterium]